MKIIALSLAATCCAATIGPVGAQSNYPSGNIRLIYGFHPAPTWFHEFMPMSSPKWVENLS